MQEGVRTSRDSRYGQDIREHADRGIQIHLFVRDQKKRARGGSAPFVYCGDVSFPGWEGDRPITVRWRLPEAVPVWLRKARDVPDDRRQHA